MLKLSREFPPSPNFVYKFEPSIMKLSSTVICRDVRNAVCSRYEFSKPGKRECDKGISKISL